MGWRSFTSSAPPAAPPKARKQCTEEKAAAAESAALKAQQEASFFSELTFWKLSVGEVVGQIGQVLAQCSCHPLDNVVYWFMPPPLDPLLLGGRAALYQVTNPVLQAAYERKKEQLAARLGATNVNEQFLFHGTSSENSEAIINHNF